MRVQGDHVAAGAAAGGGGGGGGGQVPIAPVRGPWRGSVGFSCTLPLGRKGVRSCASRRAAPLVPDRTVNALPYASQDSCACSGTLVPRLNPFLNPTTKAICVTSAASMPNLLRVPLQPLTRSICILWPGVASCHVPASPARLL